MGTEKTHPRITLIKCDDLVDHYEVRPGKNKRDFLDDTVDKHGYVCQPMSTVGFHGWEFVLPCDVKFIWDGVADPDGSHVQILEGEYINGYRLLETGTANGTITFNLGYIIETDKDHNLLMSGAPNTFIDGVAPMNAILQTDWYHWNMPQFCWKILKANEVITIPKGTPFVFIQNYPKNLLENTEFIIRDGTDEEYRRLNKYSDLRDSYRDNQEKNWQWHQLYRRGMNYDNEQVLEKPYKPSPAKPVDLRDASLKISIPRVETKPGPPRIIQQPKKTMVCPFTGATLEV